VFSKFRLRVFPALPGATNSGGGNTHASKHASGPLPEAGIVGYYKGLSSQFKVYHANDDNCTVAKSTQTLQEIEETKERPSASPVVVCVTSTSVSAAIYPHLWG